MPALEIELEFQNIRAEGYSITSPETDDYNCIAWAGGDTTEEWDPDTTSGRYWPPGVPRTLELESFVLLYRIEGGYSPCANGTLEPSVEKIAIYCDAMNQVTHAARQLPSGWWTSKLGDWEDIEHKTLSGIEGGFYGRVAQFLQRKKEI